MLRVLDMIGYHTYFKILNAKDHNLPQSRPRIFLVSIRKDIDKGFMFPSSKALTKSAKEYYDDGYVGDEYYLDEFQIKKYACDWRLKKRYSSLNADIICCQITHQGNLSNSQNFIKDEFGVRIMTPMELFALQGFKKSSAKNCLRAGLRKEQLGQMCGNSIAVPVLEDLFEELMIQYWKKDFSC